eukprot:c19260_g1_i2.p1 GENE.c19260_g1_i2~~c19260_g1_i2.p1  ORF type:complete len:725 (+),score=173.49 c19260_g1_i2:19-2193(+)
MAAAAKFAYPSVRRDESVVDNHHGRSVPDPYRALENPDGSETVEFVDAQNKVTHGFIGSCDARANIAKRLAEGFDYPKAGAPFRRGSRYFRYRNTGLQNQYVMWVCETASTEASDWRVFLDPNVLEADGTASLSSTAFTEDGSLFAYGVARGGSDWISISVRDVATGADLPDTLSWVKFSGIAWTHDNSGFFYSRYAAPASLANADNKGTEVDTLLDHTLYFHRLGTDQAADILVYVDKVNRTHMVGAEVTDDGASLLLTISNSCEPVNKVYLCPVAAAIAGQAEAAFVKLIDHFDAGFNYLLNEGERYFFLTNDAAPRYRVVAIDLSRPDRAAWTEVIPQDAGTAVLQSVSVAAGAAGPLLIGTWLIDVADYVKVYALDGAQVGALPLPSVGQVMSLNAKRKHTEVFFSFQSFLFPGSVYRHDFATGVTALFDQTLVAGLVPEDYEAKQVFYASKDGTRIPMFVIARRGLSLDGTAPTLLYGYGGFNISLQPSYSAFRLVFVRGFNGVLAVANIRGGGEYGKDWNKGGSLAVKQNCFDDFCAAAEYLVAERYTTAAKIAIMGGSNGGLLVCACANQRPELFGAVIGQVGVLDMLRFHKFSIGHAWTSDYGCADKADEFEWLIRYSPLHNVPAALPDGVQYPATLLLTSDHDDRVVPLHSLKMAATLQAVRGAAAGQHAPLLVRVETKAGHGAGKPTSKVIDEYADIYSFISLALGARFDDSRF